MFDLPINWKFPFCPSPPEWKVDWEGMVASWQWLRALDDVPQDPVSHAEGDVLIHTGMAVQALTDMDAWRELPVTERSLLFAAALLHDIAKASTTSVDSAGHISSHGHARQGERQARALLWRGDGLDISVPFPCRENIVRLVRSHGLPLWFLEKESPERALVAASWTTRLDWLALLAEADARGRICDDRQELLDRLTLFRQLGEELNCYRRPRPFPDDHSRFAYFRNERSSLNYNAFDDTTFEVILLSGLPGAGKDTWIRANVPELPVIALDRIRKELDIDPEEEQGRVVQTAWARAKVLLQQRQPFVWNATNVTRLVRDPLIDLFSEYRARVRIVYMDAPFETILRRNQSRSAPVPEAVIHRLLGKLEVPDLTEAHRVEWVYSGR